MDILPSTVTSHLNLLCRDTPPNLQCRDILLHQGLPVQRPILPINQERRPIPRMFLRKDNRERPHQVATIPYPYPYPYPPINPQNPGSGYYLMPNHGYGAPAPGFPPPQTPSGTAQPRAAAAPGQPEQASGPKHAANSPQPGQSVQPAKSLEPAQSRETGEPGNSNDLEQELPSSKPRHAAEPAQADLTVLSTNSSETIVPKHSIPADQADQPGQKT